MLNNGGISGGSSSGGSSGMGTPDGTNGGMYGGSGPSPSEYPQGPPSNPSSNSFHHHGQGHYPQHHQHQHHNNGHPHGGHPQGGINNGMMGHHSGGVCSQMSLNQGACPPDTKVRVCAGCGGAIMERFLLEAWDRFWHHMCLKCTSCGIQLADVGPTCFSREGMILCKNDYIKLFGIKGMCSGCGQHIPANEFVMRAGPPPLGSGPRMVFHVNCFTCNKCNKTLSTGDRYSVLNGHLFCEQDALKLMKQNGIGSPSNANVATSNGPTTAPRKGKVGRPRRSRD